MRCAKRKQLLSLNIFAVGGIRLFQILLEKDIKLRILQIEKGD